jgi:phosphohistidine phosphatase
MTKRLILIGHAKSSWAEPFDDHSHTLNDRGRTSAKVIGYNLEMNDYKPHANYCSDAAFTI